MSPGPAVYPCMKKETKDKNKVATIYPTETQLPTTITFRRNIKTKNQVPAPNLYPIIDENDNNETTVDHMKKMIPGKRSPLYSIGIKHSPKQRVLVLKDDEY